MKNTIRNLFSILIFVTVTPAFAAEEPSLLHTPPSGLEAEEEAWFEAQVEKDWKFESLYLKVRSLRQNGDFETYEFKRTDANTHVAVVPASFVQPPGVEYYIASVDAEGVEFVHFASEENPQPAYADGETSLTRRMSRLERHDGQTSEFELRTEYTMYGAHQTGSNQQTETGSDALFRSEIQYTYRPLEFLYDFGFGLGFMRGSSPTISIDGRSVPVDTAGDEPGLNYGFGEATIEAWRNFSVTGRLTLGASDVGFAVGVGGVVRIGRIAGTRLELGGELVEDIGSRGWMTFAWDTVPAVPMSLTLEANNQPDPGVNPAGLRFVYELGWDITERVTLLGDIGYATRTSGVSVGLVGGLKARYAF